MVDSSHLIYQEVDAFITEQLRQPYPVNNWQNWPTLYSYCQSLATIASRKGYNFYVGAKRYGMKDKKNQVAPIKQYCHPGPSLSTLDTKKAKPVFTSGPHLENVVLLLRILQTLDGIPCFKNDDVVKFFGVMHYDGMPLNIGTFPREDGKNVVFDGITPAIPVDTMIELQRNGPSVLKKYISDHCTWISEVKEYDITDARGSFFINSFTEYSTAKGSSDGVKAALSDVIHSIEVCAPCIKENKHSSCTFANLKDPCNRCKDLQNSGQRLCCTSFKIIHVSSDQASAQRKAHSELNDESANDISDVAYVRYGFGMLHFCKNVISSARNYRLTDTSSSFTITMLTAVWASKSEESTRMRQAVPAAVFSFKDRHSDELCYQTVSKSLEDIVRDTKHVLVTLVPEQYRTYAVEAKTHTLLGRPLYITTNANGDFIWTDAEFEAVVMGNRHSPAKCIVLGKWDEPGLAHANPTALCKASFNHPSGVDVMVCSTLNKEMCFVADTGNHTIRYIDGVQSIQSPKVVGTLKIHSIPEKWRPEGLAVIDIHTLAITEGTTLALINLDESLLHGQLVIIIENLHSPHGLCRNPVRSDSILVADGNVVKEINTGSKETSVIAQGFQTAFGVASAANGHIGVTDVGSHKVTILQWKNDKDAWEESTSIGSGDAGCRDGMATTAELHEPTGIAFDINSALICCIGGKNHGCIKLYSHLGFAAEFMSSVRNIYDAIGFLPKKKQNSIRKGHGTPIMGFSEGIEKLNGSLNFMQRIMTKRKAHLNRASLDGSDGSIYSKTLEGFAQTLSSLESHSRAFEELGIDATNVNMYAFANESRKEHSFAKHKQTGQYRHPTMQQYSRTKSVEEEEMIKKSCECPHSYHTNTFQAYQASHKSSLSSVSVINEYRNVKETLRPTEVNLTDEEENKLKEDLKKARTMNMITKAMPTQNVRDVYRAKCGFAPCVVDQLDATLFQQADANERYYPSFQLLMDELQQESTHSRHEKENPIVGRNEEYTLIPGDIVAVNPGIEDGIPSGDKWWLLQVNKALPCNKSASGCHVSGFWLETLPKSQQPEEGRAFRLQRGSAKTYYGSLIKTNGTPNVIPVEQLNTGWQNGSVVYCLTEEFVCDLDKISDAHRDAYLQSSDLNNTDDSDESDGDDEDETTSELSHQVQEDVLISTRKRIIRDGSGQRIRSYAELNGQRQNNSTRLRRTQLLEINNDIALSAHKKSV